LMNSNLGKGLLSGKGYARSQHSVTIAELSTVSQRLARILDVTCTGTLSNSAGIAPVMARISGQMARRSMGRQCRPCKSSSKTTLPFSSSYDRQPSRGPGPPAVFKQVDRAKDCPAGIHQFSAGHPEERIGDET
jgi:hypothetical protein